MEKIPELKPEEGDLTIDEQFKAHVDSIFHKQEEAKSQGLIPVHVEMEHLRHVLSGDELAVVESVFRLKPEALGITPIYLGLAPTPNDLVAVEPEPFIENGQQTMTKRRYMTPHVAEVFRHMATAMHDEIGRILLVNDAYRTTTKQVLLFLAYLSLFDYDLKKTAQRVALPAYSEHCTPDKQALDLQNTVGKPSDDNPTDFADTAEYKWLIKNAHRFGFIPSYPRGNKRAEDGTELNEQGMMFEPWHWRYIGDEEGKLSK